MNAGWLRRSLDQMQWCKDPLWKKDLEGNLQLSEVQPSLQISAYDRINLLMDPGWTEHDGSLYSTDPSISKQQPYKEPGIAPEKI